MTGDNFIDLHSAVERVVLLTLNAFLHSDDELDYHLDLDNANCNLKYGRHEYSDNAKIFDRVDSHYRSVGPFDYQDERYRVKHRNWEHFPFLLLVQVLVHVVYAKCE